MLKLEAWLAGYGSGIAAALEYQREPICDIVSNQLATRFPTLCYDSTRCDAIAFQQLTYHETPRRFHRLLQVLLCLQSLEVIEREYRWGWPVVQRCGVERHHLLAQVRWYFDAARVYVPLQHEDHAQMNELAATILRIIEEVTSDTLPTPLDALVRANGYHP
jgi:hypothetical protein